MPSTAIPRRDWTEQTPPFRLSADQIRICREQQELGWLFATLEQMHRRHCYTHRPIVGFANSLNTTGDIAFAADWTAHSDVHMAEALAEWERVNAGEQRLAA